MIEIKISTYEDSNIKVEFLTQDTDKFKSSMKWLWHTIETIEKRSEINKGAQ